MHATHANLRTYTRRFGLKVLDTLPLLLSRHGKSKLPDPWFCLDTCICLIRRACIYIYIYAHAYTSVYMYILICIYIYISVKIHAIPNLLQAQDVEASTSLVEAFAALEMGDLWHDAKLPEAVHYIRGSILLQIPEAWRSVLPTAL